jgi:acylphosphatase
MGGAIRQVMVVGRVQGVGYRAWVEHRAVAHDIEGWVRNRRDGSVEALFAGPAALVAAMVESCRRGPSSARVDDVREAPADADSLKLRRPGHRFSVLPTV